MIPTSSQPDGEDALRVMDINAYIESVHPWFRERGFHETEIARRMDRFGNVVQAFSTYESRWSLEVAEPFVRGINSIQLLWRENRWWVVSVFWQNESSEHPIPAGYLPTLFST